jgi:hypothetical protein
MIEQDHILAIDGVDPIQETDVIQEMYAILEIDVTLEIDLEIDATRILKIKGEIEVVLPHVDDTAPSTVVNK